MAKDKIIKMGGLAGLLCGACLIAGVIILGIADIPDPDAGQAAAWLLDLADGQDSARAVLGLFSLASFLLVGLAFGLRRALPQEGASRSAYIAVAAAATFFLLAGGVMLSVVEQLAPVYAPGGAAGRALEALADVQAQLFSYLNLVGGLMLSVGILLFGVAILRSSVLSKRLGLYSLATAIVGFIPPVGIAASALMIIWVLVLSGTLVVQQVRGARAAA